MNFSLNQLADSAFAANGRLRARGHVRAAFARAGARTEAVRAFETGGLRLRFPKSGPECEAVIINTGGGMAGGDKARVEISLASGARALVTTQAAEKIYRADGLAAESSVRFDVDDEASLVWAPQETLLFEGAALRRRLEADVAPSASLLIVEAAVFGRLAHGEAQAAISLHDDWRIGSGGRLAFAEALRLDNAGARLDRPAIGAGARAIASILWFNPRAAERLDELRSTLEAAAEETSVRLETGASALDGFLVARLISPAPRRVRDGVIAAMRCLREREAPRVWS